MNSILIKKCNKLIQAAKDNTLLYDDVINEISKNKDLMKYSVTIPNAIEYLTNAGINIINAPVNDTEDNDDSSEYKVTEQKEVISENNEFTELDQQLHDLDEIDDVLLELDQEIDDSSESYDSDSEDDYDEDDEKQTHNSDYFYNDAVSQYFRNVNEAQDRVLSSEEEKELCLAAQAGDLDAKQKMITYNLKLVISIAKRYANINPFLEYSDILQNGNLGLIKAIDKFEPDKGFKFSTYATWWIRQAITRSLACEGRTIRLPVHAVEQLRYIKKAIHVLMENNNKEEMPSNIDIANYCNEHGLVIKNGNKNRVLTEHAVAEYLRLSSNSDVISLYTPIGEDEHGEQTYLGDFVADKSNSVENTVELSDLAEKFEYIFKNMLTPKEATVLRMRFGFNNQTPMTLEQIGQALGVTRERVRQIEDKAKRKIKNKPSINKLIFDGDRI